MFPQKLWFAAATATVAVLMAALTPSTPWAAPPGSTTQTTGSNPAQTTSAPNSALGRPDQAVRPTPTPTDPSVVAAKIDAEIDNKLKAAGLSASPPASDAEFFRRVTLDLTGRIPTPEAVVEFLDSSQADKRARAIEKLLGSPAYGEHFATIWHNLIVARDSNNRNLNTGLLSDWLADRFNQNLGWDETVFELMTAAGPMNANPQVLLWLTNTENNKLAPNKITTLTGELFMGVRIGCAECHNHPFTKWKQTDFWSLAAFFSKTKAIGNIKAGNKDDKVPSLEEVEQSAKNERANGRAKGGQTAAPSTLNSAATIEIPESKGKIVAAKFLGGAQPPLKRDELFRPVLANWLTAPENPYFAQAAVNRLWAHFFGRGLVHPVDDFHEGNPPSHPLLLKLLAAEFTASGYDVKHLIRCITATQTYQRSSRPIPGNHTDDRLLSHMAVKVMSPEVLYESLRLALGEEERGSKDAPKKASAGKADKNGNKSEFLKFFNTSEDGAGADEYSHGIPQVLRLMNHKRFNSGGKHVAALIAQRVPPDKAVEQMFLATLSRRPTPTETNRFVDFLAKNPDPKLTYPQVMWVLINTSEFVLNH